jgi:hypothetical protein
MRRGIGPRPSECGGDRPRECGCALQARRSWFRRPELARPCDRRGPAWLHWVPGVTFEAPRRSRAALSRLRTTCPLAARSWERRCRWSSRAARRSTCRSHRRIADVPASPWWFEGGPYAKVRYVPCRDQARTGWPGGWVLRDREPVQVTVDEEGRPASELVVGRPSGSGA